MNERRAVEIALDNMKKSAPKAEDRRPFWKRLLFSIHPHFSVKFSGTKPNIKFEIRGGTDF